MDSLTKVVVLFAVLGILGAGVFFFPQSPFHYTKLNIIVVESADVAAEEDAATGSDAEEAMEAEESEAETAQ